MDVCRLLGRETPLEFLVLGPSVIAGVLLTSSVDKQKNSSSPSSSPLEPALEPPSLLLLPPLAKMTKLWPRTPTPTLNWTEYKYFSVNKKFIWCKETSSFFSFYKVSSCRNKKRVVTRSDRKKEIKIKLKLKDIKGKQRGFYVHNWRSYGVWKLQWKTKLNILKR